MPQQLDPFRMVERDQKLEGLLPLSAMKRLAGMLAGSEGMVNTQLHFHRNERGWTLLDGELSTVLRLECQRCLMPFDWSLEKAFSLVLVRHEVEMDSLPDDVDAYVVEQTPMMLADIIEDELILSLPAVAMHHEVDCPANELLHTPADQIHEEQEHPNPFAVLEKLKTPKHEA